VNNNFFNNNNVTNLTEETQATAEMVTTTTTMSLVDNTEINRIITGLSEQEFLTLYRWELDCLISISKGKVKACELLSKIGDANCSPVFTNVINQILIVETVNPRDELLTLLQKEARPLPVSIGTSIGKGLVDVGKFIGSVVSASNVVVTFAIPKKSIKLPRFKK
jgi:hypothetical protein